MFIYYSINSFCLAALLDFGRNILRNALGVGGRHCRRVLCVLFARHLVGAHRWSPRDGPPIEAGPVRNANLRETAPLEKPWRNIQNRARDSNRDTVQAVNMNADC